MSLRHNNPFSIEQWIAWLVGSIMGVASMVIFLYMNFQTRNSFADYKNEHQIFENELIRRLDRMENKLDQILRQ